MSLERNELKTAIDEKQFKKKYLLKLLASPLCLFPFLVGATDLILLWAFSIWSGAALFAGIAGILGAVGVFLTRLVTNNRTLTKEVLVSIQQDALRERDKNLDALDRRLSADGDPRTESCLRDLRTLAQAFEKGRSWTGALNDRSTIDILSGVDQLFKRSVRSLEKTLELRSTAAQMINKAARKPILQERERIIIEVAKSIQQLGKVLASIKTLELGDGSRESELANIRSELDQSMEVAKKVKERMNSLEREINTINNVKT